MHQSRANNIVGFLNKKSFLTPSNEKNSPSYQRQMSNSRFGKLSNKYNKFQQKNINKRTGDEDEQKQQNQYFKIQKQHNYLDKLSKSAQKQNKNYFLQDEDKINIYQKLIKSKDRLQNNRKNEIIQSYQDKLKRNKLKDDINQNTRQLTRINQKVFSKNKKQVNLKQSPANSRFLINNKMVNASFIRQNQNGQSEKKQFKTLEKQSFKPVKFESSKVEARICLTQLQQKLAATITSIQQYLYQISTQYQKILRNHLHKLRSQVLITIQQVFNNFQEHVNECFNNNKQSTIKSLVEEKYQLKSMQQKIQNMKQELESQNNWRRVAGEIISNNLQQQVQRSIDQLEEKLYKEKENSEKWFNIKNYKPKNLSQNTVQPENITNLKKALQRFFYDQ